MVYLSLDVAKESDNLSAPIKFGYVVAIASGFLFGKFILVGYPMKISLCDKKKVIINNNTFFNFWCKKCQVFSRKHVNYLNKFTSHFTIKRKAHVLHIADETYTMSINFKYISWLPYIHLRWLQENDISQQYSCSKKKKKKILVKLNKFVNTLIGSKHVCKTTILHCACLWSCK